jgi:hypothetical protein
MSDNFELLVDVDAAAGEAADLSRAVLDRFRKVGLIAGRANGDCVLRGKGYRPGPAVPDAFKRQRRECRFWELVTCGVEARVGRGFNAWALGPVCEGLGCPSCGSEFEPFGDALGDAIEKAIGEWIQQSGRALVPCPQCRTSRPITEWGCKPPLGFGNLAFCFWNWPPLDSPSWKIDIAAMARDVTGHTIVRTYGHV